LANTLERADELEREIDQTSKRGRSMVMRRKIWANRDGQALLEFAIILPVLLAILLGIVEFGLILYNQHVITNASREGARYGIVSRSPRRSIAEIEAVVNAYCADNLITFGSGTPAISVDPDPSTNPVFGTDLTVEVTFPYDFLVLPNFVGTLAGVQNLRAHTTMKYE
jgi:Flp pilus assembly protein TadG